MSKATTAAIKTRTKNIFKLVRHVVFWDYPLAPFACSTLLDPGLLHTHSPRLGREKTLGTRNLLLLF